MPTFSTPASILTGVSRLVAASFIALGFFAQPASAAVLFDQTGTPQLASRNSSILNFVGGSPGFRAADNFVLGSAAQVGAIQWVGTHNNGSEIDNFTFTFYADAAGAPGAVLLETTGSLTTTNIILPPNTDARFYSTVLTVPFSAAAGTTYWLSIFNVDAGASWAWDESNVGGGGSVQRQNDRTDWDQQALSDLYFRLEDVPAKVPVPASLMMVVLGMGLLGRLSRQPHRA